MDNIGAYNPRLIVTFQISHVGAATATSRSGRVAYHAVKIKTFDTAAWYMGRHESVPIERDGPGHHRVGRRHQPILFLKVYEHLRRRWHQESAPSRRSRWRIHHVQRHPTHEDHLEEPGSEEHRRRRSGLRGHPRQEQRIAAPLARPRRHDLSLVNAHPITAKELAAWKQSVGVAEKGKNYNKVIDGHGTGFRPPTEEEWAEIARSTMVIDSLKYDQLGAPPSVDLSASTAFPPIGNQGGVGLCVAWSMGYYVKTFQEALEHGWNLSTVKSLGSYPTYPDSQLNHIMSPSWIYNQINGGIDGGSTYLDAADLIFNLGAASWNTVPYSGTDYTSWPSVAGDREAPLYRGAKPLDAEWGMHYVLNVTTDAQIAILKTLLSSNIPVSISVDADKYANLTSDDAWDITHQ